MPNPILHALLTLSVDLSVPAPEPADRGALTGARVVDVTGDGSPDRVVFGSHGELSIEVHVGGRDYVLVPQELPRARVAQMLVTDLDADGLPDLYLVARSENVALLGDGTGLFVDRTSQLGLADTGVGVSGERVDLDGDGNTDLLLRNVDGDVIFWAEGSSGFVRADGSGQIEVAPDDAWVSAPAVPSPEDASREEPSGAGGVDPRAHTSSGSGRRGASSARGSATSGGTADTSAPDLSPSSPAGPAAVAQPCDASIQDIATGACVTVSSVPAVGSLLPLNANYFVDAGGSMRVGGGSGSGRLRIEHPGNGADTAVLQLVDTGTSKAWNLLNRDNSNNFIVQSFDGTNYRHPFAIEPSTPGNTLHLAAGGDVGIGTDAPTARLEVAGDLKVDGSALFVEGSTDRVGIGTTSPWTDLDVAGGLRVDSVLYVNAATHRVGVGTSTPSVDLDVNGDFEVGVGNSTLYVDGDGGRVGLGTTTPAEQLHARSYGHAVLRLEADRDGSQPGEHARIDFSKFNEAETAHVGWKRPSPDHYDFEVFTNGAASPLVLGTSGVERVRILEGGNVGVGKSDPVERLDVSGSVRTDSKLISTAAFGPPLEVASTALVADLNADLLDSMSAEEFRHAGVAIDAQDIAAGAISDSHVNLGAGIDGEKVVPDFGSQAVATSGLGTFGSLHVSGDVEVDGAVGIGVAPASMTQPLEVAGDVFVGGGSQAYDGSHEVLSIEGRTARWQLRTENAGNPADTELDLHWDDPDVPGSGTIALTLTRNGDLSAVGNLGAGGSGAFGGGMDVAGNTDLAGDLDVAGTTTTRILTITGGSDLVESFDTTGACHPGTVVVIDPERPGRLKPSSAPYDARVAGVVSGAGGIRPGIHMSQAGVADGDTPIAMVGRVWVRASVENGPIAPGDLLTTARKHGHAMVASDLERRPGTVIGKAMTALDEDGLVLVLVNLQ